MDQEPTCEFVGLPAPMPWALHAVLLLGALALAGGGLLTLSLGLFGLVPIGMAGFLVWIVIRQRQHEQTVQAVCRIGPDGLDAPNAETGWVTIPWSEISAFQLRTAVGAPHMRIWIAYEKGVPPHRQRNVAMFASASSPYRDFSLDAADAAERRLGDVLPPILDQHGRPRLAPA
jgi:hypothetical protein